MTCPGRSFSVLQISKLPVFARYLAGRRRTTAYPRRRPALRGDNLSGLREPAPIARRGPAGEALRQARPGRVVSPGAPSGGDEGILEHLALGVAAADPRQFGERRAELVGRQRVV